MVGAHEITQDERARMTSAAFYRRQRDPLAPFAQDVQFRGLVVEQCITSVIPHPAWLAYERHGDKAVLATDLALFFRSTFVPSSRTALAAYRGASEHEEFGDRLEGRLKRRLIQDPTPARHHVSMLVVAKRTADRSSRGGRDVSDKHASATGPCLSRVVLTLSCPMQGSPTSRTDFRSVS
jgi:hypothetical protein